jgi:LmbE family N-acetylglucosaminyl deacetylase
LHWQSEASLLIFESPNVDANVLVVAPHPDDAEAAAFGMYSEVCQASVVTVTAGERAIGMMPVWLTESIRTHWTARLRVADSLGTNSSLRHISLVYPDAALESMHREPHKSHRLGCEDTLPRAMLRATNTVEAFQNGAPDCRWSDLVADLRLVLRVQSPRTIICPHPLLDGHSDHVFTAVALEEALRDFHGVPPVLLLYVVHNRNAPLYPLGPMQSVAGLPPGRSDQWLASSIYSHPLNEQARLRKYFALQAMHAMRSHADYDPHSALGFIRWIKQTLSAHVAGLAVYPASLLRRACRPDEIYYVVSASEFRQLIQRLPS